MRKIAEFLKADLLFYEEKPESYDVLVYRVPTGIVVRKLCDSLKDKFEDPAVVVIDPTLSYAIPILGGHEGANEVAKKLEALGMKAVITTSAEFDSRFSVGVGFRRNSSAEEIVKAVEEALSILGISEKDVKIVATAMVKKRSKAFREAIKMLRIPAGFVSSEALNAMKLKETSAVKIGIKNVAEGCALFYSKNKELVMPKKVFGGVTVAVAR